jgi:hypothetical protein
MRKPTSAKVGSLEVSSLAAVDSSENTESLTQRQALRVRERLAVSWPMARAVAELAFQSGRAA